jgi:hypothetical protein
MTYMRVRHLLGATLLALATASCGDVVRQSQSPVLLNVVSLAGCAPQRAGDACATFTNPLLSDVETNGSIFNDVGQVAFEAFLKDPGNTTVPTVPTSNNDVLVSRYRVVYRRADGRNTPGVDVPHPFDGALTARVLAGGQLTTSTLELVRHVAKIEAPLIQLRSNLSIITVIAEVTFYGQDRVGNDISATGTLHINFGNFADPPASGQ